MAHLSNSPPKQQLHPRYVHSHLSSSAIPPSYGGHDPSSTSSESDVELGARPSPAPAEWASPAGLRRPSLNELQMAQTSSTESDSDGEEPDAEYRSPAREGTGLGLSTLAHNSNGHSTQRHKPVQASSSSRRRSSSSSNALRASDALLAGPSGARALSHALPSSATAPNLGSHNAARRNSHRLSSDSLRSPVDVPLSRSASSSNAATAAQGQKGKARERAAVTYSLPVSRDPLNPLSSLSSSRLPSVAAGLALHSAPADAGSDSDRASGGLRRSRTAGRPISPAAEPEPADAPANGNVLSSTISEHSHETSSNHRPTSVSSASSTAASHGPPSASSGATKHEPTLQELLQSVNLAEAFKLVTELQSSQNVLKPPAPATPNSAGSFAQQQAAAATSVTVQPAIIRKPNKSPAELSRPLGGSAAEEVHASEAIAAPLPPLASARVPVPPSPAKPTAVGAQDPNGSADVGRRKSLSMHFSLTSSKRDRVISNASSLKQPFAQPGKTDKPRLERAGWSEYSRQFEEEISRVHLHLSPATLERKQAAAKYLELRYKPLLAALSEPQEAGATLAHPLAVAHWRYKKLQREQQLRAIAASGTTKSLVSTSGSAKQGRQPAKVYLYGRRRKNPPSTWEVYPDEIVDFVAAGGQDEEAVETPSETGVTSPTGSERQVDNLFAGGGSLRNGISRVTSRGTASSEHSSLQGAAQSLSAMTASPTGLSPSDKHYRVQELTGRPGYSRQSSHEGSPLARTTTGGNSVRSRSSSIADAHEASLAGSSSLRRASSIGSNASITKSAKQQPMPTIPSRAGSNFGLLEPFTSPKRPEASFSRASLDRVPASPTSTQPRKEFPIVGSPIQLQSPHAQLQRRESTVDGLRRGLARFTGRGASTDLEGSDGGTSVRRRKSMWEGDSPHNSDNEFRSPAGRFSIRNRFASPVANGHSSDHTANRPRVSRRLYAAETDGYKSSGGEEGSHRHRTPKHLLRGFRGPPSRLNPPELGASGELIVPAHSRPFVRSRRIRHRDSDDEELVVVQPTLDVSEDEFVHLTAAERQAKAQLLQLEQFVPKVPIILSDYLHALASHKESTTDRAGIEVEYVYPRLPGAVLADIAAAKEGLPAGVPPSPFVDGSSETSTNTSSDTSTDASDDGETGHHLPRPAHTKKSVTYGGLSPTGGRAGDLAIPTQQPSRRVTNPAVRRIEMRPRSQTLGGAMLGLGAPVLGPLGHKEDRLTQPRAVDPLPVLERSLTQLEERFHKTEEDAARVSAAQQRLKTDIEQGKNDADELGTLVASSLEPKLSSLAERVRRTKEAAERPDEGLMIVGGKVGEFFLNCVKFIAKLLSATVLALVIWVYNRWYGTTKVAKRRWGEGSTLLPPSTFRITRTELVAEQDELQGADGRGARGAETQNA